MMRLILGAAAALILTAGQAAADGLPKRGKTKADTAERPCSIAAETGVSTEKAIRGFSESIEDFAVLGGVELTCGRFYAGVDGSSVNVAPLGSPAASALLELAFGIRPKTGPITWDFGVIYHAYNANQSTLNFYELKAGASAEIWRGGTLGATVLYTPEYGGRAGLWMGQERTWTVEGSFAQELPKIGIFTPTISAVIGKVSGEGNAALPAALSVDEYVFWNVGLALDFLENWSLDLRYSDTDIGHGCVIPVGPAAGIATCDGRFLASLKYTF
jgi:uncharacterized protein (TIGR02001 family)